MHISIRPQKDSSAAKTAALTARLTISGKPAKQSFGQPELDNFWGKGQLLKCGVCLIANNILYHTLSVR
jgi:hypothetical protein